MPDSLGVKRARKAYATAEKALNTARKAHDSAVDAYNQAKGKVPDAQLRRLRNTMVRTDAARSEASKAKTKAALDIEMAKAHDRN